MSLSLPFTPPQNRLTQSDQLLQRHTRRLSPSINSPSQLGGSSPPLPVLLPALRTRDASVAFLAGSEYSATGETTASDRDGHHNTDQRGAALRQLNGVLRQQAQTRSVGSSGTASSQPVLVRTYSKATRPDSTRRVPIIRGKGNVKVAALPPMEAFRFDGIMKSIEPEISGTLDAIAAICANSRYSLSNQYEVHMPPHDGLKHPVDSPLELEENENQQIRDGDVASIDHALSWNTNGQSVTHDHVGPIAIGHAPSSLYTSPNVIMTRVAGSVASDDLLRHAVTMNAIRQSGERSECSNSRSIPKLVRSPPTIFGTISAPEQRSISDDVQHNTKNESLDEDSPTTLLHGIPLANTNLVTNEVQVRPHKSQSPGALASQVLCDPHSALIANAVTALPSGLTALSAHRSLSEAQRTSVPARSVSMLNHLFSWLGLPSNDKGGAEPALALFSDQQTVTRSVGEPGHRSAEESLKTLLVRK